MVKFTGTSMVRGRKALGSNPKDRERRFLPEFSAEVNWRREVSFARTGYECAQARSKGVTK